MKKLIILYQMLANTIKIIFNAITDSINDIFRKFKEFLWFLAGAEIFILKDCPSAQNKFLKTGIIIFLISIISGISAGFAVYGSFDKNFFASLFIGFLWFIVILTLDSLIVSTIRDTDSYWKKIKQATPRVILSVLIGMVIARPMEIKIFEKEIKKEIGRMEAEIGEEKTRLNTKLIREEESGVKKDIEKTENEIKKISEEIDCLEKLRQYERDGIEKELPCGKSSRVIGWGPEHERIERKIDSCKKRLGTLLAEKNAKEKKKESLFSEIKKERDKNVNESSKKAEMEIPSLLDANKALHRLIKNDLRGVGVTILFITVLIVCIELLPTINKILFQTPSEEYEKKLAEFKSDIENMVYLDLITKYPHLPARKSYLKNYQNNRIIYQDLLKEYTNISELNAEVQNKIDITLERLKNEKIVQDELHKEILEKMKQSQIAIIEQAIKIWEKEMMNDVKNNPDKYVNIPNVNTSNTQNIHTNITYGITTNSNHQNP